ncbi:WcbI family polysaccharide biosynthesis putative acetyltransferase [Kocuria palustris]|uniref:WcbI family polysaccharide biosynthesis putative acetyltransferase n=1 Tax=Kocuria palustris TaxID=71999 RepID=UPI001642CD52|nr:WcbI family polysaccharide biosynthesis putative acetyltransferase [Kocuria palustris]
MSSPGRLQHYAGFYAQEDPVAESDDRALVVVIGNCQAESLRILLDSDPGLRSVRVPPVFEWDDRDVAAAARLLARTDALVMQHVRDDYRGLPSGTRQLEALLPPSSLAVRVPVLRYAGLHPFQVIVRDPDDSSLDPPGVPYSDLRTLALAAHGADGDDGSLPPHAPELDAQTLERLHEESVGQLGARERAHGTVVMSDVLETRPHWHTINHPDNATLTALAERVLAELGRGLGFAPDPAGIPDPGRELLRSIEAPVDPDHARALGARLRPDARHDGWRVGPPDDFVELDEATIAREQLAFCRARPRLVERGLQRHGERMRMLGLLA